MKVWIRLLTLSALLCSSMVSASNTENNNSLNARSYWNPITVFNHASYDVQYAFFSSNPLDQLYKIKRNSQDTYHSGVGDKRARFFIMACTERDPNGFCLNEILYKSTPEHYNAEEITAVKIHSAFDIEVICRDGSSTSCIVK